MKIWIFLIITLILGLNLLTAQNRNYSQGADRLWQNILKLKVKIEKIKDLAERYNNEKALQTILDAEQDFNQAISLLNQWLGGDHKRSLLDEAKIKYQSASRKTDLASSLILQIPVENLRTVLEQLLQKIESIAHNNNSQEVKYYLNKARAFSRKANNVFAQNQYLKGHEFLKVGIYFANKVIEMAGSDQPRNNKKRRFEDRKNNIQIMINKAANIINDDPILNDLKNSTQEYYEKALSENEQGKTEKAFANLQIAEKFLNRLFDLAEKDNTNSDVDLKREYQSLGIYLNSVKVELEKSNQKSKIFEKAEGLYVDAGKNLQEGNLKKAALNMRLVQRMALKVFKQISASSQKGNFDDLQNRINEVENLLRFQEEKVDKSNNKSVNGLYLQAEKHFSQAQTAYSNGRNNQAFYLLGLCLRILNRNEQLLDTTVGRKDLSLDNIQSDLLSTEQLIGRLEINPDLSKNQIKKIEILKNLISDAKEELQKKNLLAAQQILIIVKNQLSNTLKD